jgi:hypothetical protein
MKYNYFVSYLSIRKVRCGYGNCLITLDHEINSIDDIRAIENGINADVAEKGFKGVKCSVISYQLINSHPSTVEEAKKILIMKHLKARNKQ